MGTTIISKVETLRGRHDFLLKADSPANLLRAQQLLARTEDLLGRMLIVSLDEEAVAHFDRLRTRKGLKKIGRADLLIASIALASNATLATRNLRHFQRIPGLRLDNWVD